MPTIPDTCKKSLTNTATAAVGLLSALKTQKKISCLLMLSVLIIALTLSGVRPALSQTIVLNTANDPPNSTDDHDGIGDRIMTEAFRRMGINLRIVKLPSERALINANNGVDDGNFARVEGMEKLYPNLMRVQEDITSFEFVAFSKKVSLRTASWETLKPYNVGIITGWKILESNIQGVKSLTKVKDEKILFPLLTNDKVDLVVYDRLQGKVFLQQHAADNIRVLKPPLAVKKMYPYLHKRHAELVPRLEQTLRVMKADGSFNRITREALKTFFPAE